MPRLLLSFLVLVLLLPSAQAQQSMIPYTSNNSILINMEGYNGTYDFATGKMLVRYNEYTQKLECLLPISNLVPANDSTPIVMAHDVFYAARFPDIYIEIAAPVELINGSNRSRQTVRTRLSIIIQGITKEIVTPMTFTPDRSTIAFGGSFEVLLDEMRLKIPAKYAPMLTGRIRFTIHNARWAELHPR